MRKKINIIIPAIFGILTTLVANGCKVSSVVDEFERVNPGTLPEKDPNKDYSPLKRYSETVTIKVLGIDYTAIGDIPTTFNGKPSGPANNAFNEAALKYLNIKLDYVSTISGERYEDRLNTLIAAGELPDLFRVTNDTTLETLKQSELLADLSDSFYYLNENFQNMYQSNLYKPAFETCMDNGKLYSFPNVDNPNETAQKLYIRKDWLKVCNKNIPSTYEELVDVARAFKQNANKIALSSGLQTKDIIPIGITKAISSIGNNTAAGFFNIFGAQPSAFFEKEGKLIDSNVSIEAKEALSQLHMLYEEGLIAKEFYNYTDTKVSNDIIAGKVGIVSGMRHNATYPLQESVSNESTPTAEWVSIELPSFNNRKALPVVQRVLIQDYYCASRSFKNKEALALLSNLFYDMFYNNNAYSIYGDLCKPSGGFFYSWVPVKLWYTPYTIDSYKRVRDVFNELYEAGFRISDSKLKEMENKEFDWNTYYEEMASGDYKNIFNKLWIRERDNGFKYGYPYMQALKDNKDSTTMVPFEKKGYGIFEQAISNTGGDAYVCDLSEGKKQAKYNEFYGVKTPSQQNYGEYLLSTTNKFYLKVITGEEDIKNWDGFVNDYNKNGGSAVLEQVNQWYTK